MDWAKTDLGATKKNVSTLWSCKLYKLNSSSLEYICISNHYIQCSVHVYHALQCNIDNRYYVVYTGTVDCLVDSIVVIIIVIHMQPNAVSETWDASSVSETLDGGVR